MVLTVDIGNTNIKSGVFNLNELSDFRIHSSLNGLFLYIDNHPPKAVIICSVNPAVEAQMLKGLNERKIDWSTITYKSRFNLLVDYKTPQTLGIDRLCSAEGAFFLFRNSEKYKSYMPDTFVLAIDFGTASTINVIEYPGKFTGGLIAPGIEMMFDSLQKKTAQLPQADVSGFTSTIGKDTNSSIASGVLTSVTGLVEGTINYLKKEKSAEEIVVYITGGNARKIFPHMNLRFSYVEGLVLYGINALKNINFQKL
jgi:type III pantothenate kinase